MKKIINGKMYNTETAKKLADYSHLYPSDFNYFEETLYKKKTGEYFLYGKGNAASKYAVSEGSNSWSSGWDITPMSELAVRAWLEKHCDADEYIAIFGEPEE